MEHELVWRCVSEGCSERWLWRPQLTEDHLSIACGGSRPPLDCPECCSKELQEGVVFIRDAGA